ncbi:MAG: CAP domain-containing protein [Polyangiales bacterium]
MTDVFGGRFEPITRTLRIGVLLMVLAPEGFSTGCATEVSDGSLEEPDAATSDEPRAGKDTGVDPADGSAPPPPPPVDGGAPLPADDLQRCVDVINAYRAKLGRTAYRRSAALEAFAAEGAKQDSKSGSPHGHFMSTSGGSIAWAENEISGWSLDDSGSVRVVLEDGLKMMWGEGPGGGHYENMASRTYKEVGCGIYVTAGKDVWIVQDFK